MKILVISVLIFGLFKVKANTLLFDETLLLSSQGLGHSLYINCILTPPISETAITYCVTTKASYITSLYLLNKPLKLTIADRADPYLPNPFSPCGFEIAYLILPDICVGG